MTEVISMTTMTPAKKASYSIGVQAALQLKQQFSEIDLDTFLEGFQEAYHGETLKLSVEEINGILAGLQRGLQAQHKNWIADLAKNNKKAGEAYLAANKAKDGVVVLDSGLQYKILSCGDSEAPAPTLLDTVKVHYRGYFIDEKVFDSSYQRGEPAVFPVNRVIAGWSEALQLMHVGDKWQVFIPSYLAYGEAGFGQHIGPNTALIFELELIAIQ